MSANLGPIHHWLYEKIKLQQNIIEDILLIRDKEFPHLLADLNEKYGILESKPLEEVINPCNIHGWLQNQITIAEYQLAESITVLVKNNSALLNQIEDIFLKKGQELSQASKTDNAQEAYKIINDCLLDGMPCDHINQSIETGPDQIIWEQKENIHQKYWDEVSGDINLYNKLREYFMIGSLIGTNLMFETNEENQYIIKKK